MELSNEQQIAYDKYIQGENIFITGPGGAGKSALIKKIYHHACSRNKNIHVCALTGCAAVLLNCKAKTLHSWAGIGLGNGSIEQLVKKVRVNKYTKSMWLETDILVVDEVSMLSLRLFDTLNTIGKIVRKNARPFGGIQLIFSGDFYQLPPVGDKEVPPSMQFCFESDDWYNVFDKASQIQLIKIFRQTDEVYSTILNQIRVGRLKRKSNDLLVGYVGRKIDENIVIEPTKLFPTKSKVENLNRMKMDLIEENEIVFDRVYPNTSTSGNDNETTIKMEVNYLARSILCEERLVLKKGAQVMCIVNIKSDNDTEPNLCNGSQGVVTGFCLLSGCPIVKFNNGIETTMMRHTWTSEKFTSAYVSQIPLILAWALTIHKSQGATLDMAEIDVGSGIFECGQTYVALSRVKSLDGLYLTSFDASKIKINKKVREYYESLNEYRDNTGQKCS